MNTSEPAAAARGKTRRVNPGSISPDLIREAVAVMEEGGTVVYPTTCLYGLGADAFNTESIDRIYQIKGRSPAKPLLVLVRSESQLAGLVRHVPHAARAIMERFWPGGVTIVFSAERTLPGKLTAGTGRIGVRLPAHPVASALLADSKHPVIGTSANISDSPGCARISDMDPKIIDGVDLVLDAGRLKGGTGSTVVDVTFDPPKILREGAVAAADIYAVL